MPLVGSRCELNPDELVPAQECIECSAAVCAPRGRRCRMTTELLEYIFFGGSDRSKAGVSATMLTGPCLRKAYLQSVVDYYQLPSKSWPAVRGTLLHGMMERARPREGIIRETRFARQVNSTGLITGQVDKLDLRTRTLVDFKTKDELPEKVEDMPGYIRQLNIYRWILQDGYDVETGEHISVDVQTLGLILHTMGGFAKYGVPLVADDSVAEFVEQRLAVLVQAQQTGDWPERGLDPEAAKFCIDWCPVRDECLTYP